MLHFRRTLHLDSVPANYIVRVSADNRFVLYLNGQRVGDGPARGDLVHWRYARHRGQAEVYMRVKGHAILQSPILLDSLGEIAVIS